MRGKFVRHFPRNTQSLPARPVGIREPRIRETKDNRRLSLDVGGVALGKRKGGGGGAMGQAALASREPAYYDLEDYGDESAQLGRAKSYREFLSGLAKVAGENYRALKSGSFCVWFVGDFRRDKVFIPYHIDTINMMQAVGFTLWDILIVNFLDSIRAAFTTQIVDTQILPKIHEYGLVFRK
jgi:hypothetical protein